MSKPVGFILVMFVYVCIPIYLQWLISVSQLWMMWQRDHWYKLDQVFWWRYCWNGRTGFKWDLYSKWGKSMFKRSKALLKNYLFCRGSLYQITEIFSFCGNNIHGKVFRAGSVEEQGEETEPAMQFLPTHFWLNLILILCRKYLHHINTLLYSQAFSQKENQQHNANFYAPKWYVLRIVIGPLWYREKMKIFAN